MTFFKFSTLLVAVLFLTFKIYAQNKLDIDSLLTVYHEHALDTIKVKTLNNIVNYYMYRDIQKAKGFVKAELQLSEKLKFQAGIALANYQLGVVYENLDRIDSAKYYYNVSLKEAKVVNNPIYISQAYHGLAILEFHQGNLVKADSMNTLDLEHCIAHKDTMGTALAYDFKGTVHQNQGYYAIALSNVLNGLKLLEALGDSIRIADALNHLATLEYNFGNFEKSIEYNTQALSIYEDYNDNYFQAQALNDIGVSYKSQGRNDEALTYFRKSIEKAKIVGVKAIQAAALTNIGSVYIDWHQPEKAIDYLKQSTALSRSINAKRRIALSQNKMAEAWLLLNQPAKALAFTDEAIKYASASTNNSIWKTALRLKSNAFEMLGKADSSLSNYKKYKALSDTILNKEKVQKIEELRMIHETEKKEAALALQKEEIKTLNAKAKVDKLNRNLYAGGMITFFVVSGLLFFGFRQRMKKNRIQQEKQEAIYQQKIEYKKKELASQTLHLVQKNTFIQELKENLERLKDSPEKFKMEFRRIVMLLKKENASDKNWEVFKSYFADVHNDFDRKLKQHADISDNEVRLAAFLRMNLTTKEISAVLNVLPDSILKSKYRLKKKLGLDKETDLNSFLNAL